MPKENNNSLYWLLSIPFIMFGLIGAFIGFYSGNALTGFFIGLGIVLTITGLSLAWDRIQEWLKKEMDSGKLFPYILVGIIIAIAWCGYLAINLGQPSCIDYDSDARSCVEYADNAFSPTNEQMWGKFWNNLPVTALITILVSVIVHSNIHKKMKDEINSN